MVSANIIYSRMIKLPEHELDSIAEPSNFLKYLAWENCHNLLQDAVISPFIAATKKQSKYSNENIPEKTEIEELEAGKANVAITTILQGDVTDHTRVFNEFSSFVHFLEDQYKSNVKREGVFTGKTLKEGGFVEEPYVEIDILRQKVKRDREEFKQERSGIQQRVKLLAPKDILADTPESFTVAFKGRNYGVFTEINAFDFQRAGNMQDMGERMTIGYETTKDDKDGRVVQFKKKPVVMRFKWLLLYDSLQQLGEWPRETVRIEYPMEKLVFYHRIKPQTRCEYKEVIEELFKPKGKSVSKRSKIGDLAIAEEIVLNPDFEKTVRNNELIDDQFMLCYNPSISPTRKNPSVRLYAVRDKLRIYEENHTNRYIEQKIELDPVCLIPVVRIE